MNRLVFMTVLLLLTAQLHAQQEKVTVIENTVPKNGDSPYAEISLLYTIPTYDESEDYAYGISMVYDLAVDKNGNIYVLGKYEDNIVVFDRNGKYVRTIGREGDGPGEFRSPNNIAIRDNEMHVFQVMGSLMQVLDLEGNYIRKFTVPGGNYRFITLHDDYYLTMIRKTRLETGSSATTGIRVGRAGRGPDGYFSVEMRDKDFELIRNIAYVETDPPLTKTTRHFNLLSSSNIDKFIYFPQNTDKYEITKYDLEGNALLTIVRDYKQSKFTKPVMDFKNQLKEYWIDYYDSQGVPNIYRNQNFVDPPDRPWVIRKILIDDHQNVWVLAGEWSGDTQQEVSVESTLDVFSPEGIYLASQKTSAISYLSIINNGRLYTLVRKESPVTTDELEEIRVYEIKYRDR